MAVPESATPPLSIRLFGPFEVSLYGAALTRLRSRKGHWLLALLVLRHGCEVERAWLAGMLWPDSHETAALINLRNSLTDLRRALGPEAGRLHSPTSRTLGLDLSGVECDVIAFDRAVASVDAASLTRAASLYRGPLLEECAEEWAFQERQARQQAYLGALETLAARALAAGDPGTSEGHLRRAVAVDPLRESAQRALMQALAIGGNYAAALLTYRELRLLLHRELNAEPDPETMALFEQIRAEARASALPGADRSRGPLARQDARASLHKVSHTRSGPVPIAKEQAAAETQKQNMLLPSEKRHLPLSALLRFHLRQKRTRLTAAALIALFVLAGVIWRSLDSGVDSRAPVVRPEGRNSIAVLPFVNMGSDQENEYLADGITDDLITALAQVPGLRVPGRTSAFQFKGKNVAVRKIGEQLKVAALLEGSVRSVGNTTRVTAQLVDVATGYHLWARSYDLDRKDLFTIQDEVCRTIVDTLKVRLAGEQETGVIRHHTRNVEAYKLYVKGRHFWNKRTERNLKKAIHFFQEAIDSDPTYAVAYSGLADTYHQLGYGNYLAPRDAFPKAKSAAAMALQLDPRLAEAHASLGYVRMYFDWDFPAAERDFQRAIRLNPSYVAARHWHSVYLTAMQRPKEARDEIARAQQLDPLSVPIATDVGFELHYNGQNEQAIQQLRSALEMNPKFPLAHFWLGRIYTTQGRYDQALTELEAVGPTLREWQPTLAARGYLYGVWGKRAQAQRVLEDFRALAARGKFVTSYGVALVYAGLGDTEQAFLWLDKACAERSHWLVWLRLDPRWATLRTDLRFKALLRKVGWET
jgi:TolB-like protein/DNA-binding SARP family transcriptional activator/tetratricopeptide (TPR) repeat protein